MTILFLEGPLVPAEFSSDTSTQKFLVILKTLISWLRCVWGLTKLWWKVDFQKQDWTPEFCSTNDTQHAGMHGIPVL